MYLHLAHSSEERMLKPRSKTESHSFVVICQAVFFIHLKHCDRLRIIIQIFCTCSYSSLDLIGKHSFMLGIMWSPRWTIMPRVCPSTPLIRVTTSGWVISVTKVPFTETSTSPAFNPPLLAGVVSPRILIKNLIDSWIKLRKIL